MRISWIATVIVVVATIGGGTSGAHAQAQKMTPASVVCDENCCYECSDYTHCKLLYCTAAAEGLNVWRESDPEVQKVVHGLLSQAKATAENVRKSVTEHNTLGSFNR